MDADEIRDRSERYDEAYDDEHQTLEEDLHQRLAGQQYITQDQLAKVIGWNSKIRTDVGIDSSMICVVFPTSSSAE